MYDRQISDEQILTFGVSGMLYRNGLIMYDHQTESLWSHVLGQAVAGKFKGTQLNFIPTLHTTWQEWKKLHPDTLVVSPSLFGRDSYESYYFSSREGVVGQGSFGGGLERGDDIYPKEFVIGVRLAGQPKAYPFSALQKEPVINDQIEDIPIAVFFDKLTLSGAVFDRRLEDGTILSFAQHKPDEKLVVDTQTQSEWDIFSGTAVSGPLEGTQLVQVPVTYAFWFGWIDYHTDSTVYGRER